MSESFGELGVTSSDGGVHTYATRAPTFYFDFAAAALRPGGYLHDEFLHVYGAPSLVVEANSVVVVFDDLNVFQRFSRYARMGTSLVPHAVALSGSLEVGDAADGCEGVLRPVWKLLKSSARPPAAVLLPDDSSNRTRSAVQCEQELRLGRRCRNRTKHVSRLCWRHCVSWVATEEDV
jgi:hypothetical protein